MWYSGVTNNMIHMYRMVRLLSTLPAGKDMDQLLKYYFKQSTQISVSVGRYMCVFLYILILYAPLVLLSLILPIHVCSI